MTGMIDFLPEIARAEEGNRAGATRSNVGTRWRGGQEESAPRFRRASEGRRAEGASVPHFRARGGAGRRGARRAAIAVTVSYAKARNPVARSDL